VKVKKGFLIREKLVGDQLPIVKRNREKGWEESKASTIGKGGPGVERKTRE